MKVEMSTSTTTVLIIIIIVSLIAGILSGIYGKGCCTPPQPIIDPDTAFIVQDSFMIPVNVDSAVKYVPNCDDSIKQISAIFELNNNERIRVVHTYHKDKFGALVGYFTRDSIKVTPTINYPIDNRKACLNNLKVGGMATLGTVIVVTGVIIFLHYKYNIINFGD